MTVQDNDLRLDRQLCFGLSVASRSVVAAYKPVLAELSLTHPQYLVMLALWEQAPRQAKDISGALLLEPATLSPLLKRLEALGYVSRHRSAADQRALAVDLTPAGAALREKALSVPGTMLSRLGLDRDSASALHHTMMALIDAATRADDAPPAHAQLHA
ncbi:MarR family transcriptional regulator [Arthrobacter livingstonensis]|uniref:HTH-type transcriptional regulator MgrA n=1 Tax=Arthrobacter livingstonensis TaxID=670078 RepID=A0A2V5LHM1_9MICC|nr:MarR family transcriptional regulator [Arthrobacter livingstonensis]PYI69563.1 MarR family transcriptional regulator [Arthrobacter livingstonensis]